MRRTFNWLGSPEGRFAKILIGIQGDNDPSVIVASMKLTIPWFWALYEKQRGEPLTADIIKSRWLNMHKHDSEHYKRSPVLRPFVQRVRTALEEAGDQRISRKRVKEIMS